MRKTTFSLFLALLIAGCTGTYTINQRGLSVSWPEFEPTLTATMPAPTATGQATMDATPTPEVNVTVIPGTPVVFPTNEPLPALLPVVDVLNVRAGAGTGREWVGSLGRTDCVAFDPSTVIQANGYAWIQVYDSRFGEGVWLAAKVIGGNHLVRFYTGQPCVFEVNYPLP